MKSKIPKPPSELGPDGRKFFRKIVLEYELDSHHVELLTQGCKCLDRIASARKMLDAEGVVIRDRFGCPRPHPAVAVELQNKTIFSRLLRELGLDVPQADSRPPRLGGQKY
jgi:phage terminase small subunit